MSLLQINTILLLFQLCVELLNYLAKAQAASWTLRSTHTSESESKSESDVSLTSKRCRFSMAPGPIGAKITFAFVFAGVGCHDINLCSPSKRCRFRLFFRFSFRSVSGDP